ncbi:MAG: hypothetical protein ACUVTY_03500 [Armatimonadota bacterium]
MSRPSSSKAVIWIIIAAIAIVLAVFSAYKSFVAPKQGKAIGHLDIAPGGKAGLMKGGPSAEGMEQPTPAGR